MKKIISLLLAVVLVISAVPMAYAADTQDYSLGTEVKYTAANNENYTITVPARLAPGQGGTVTLDGFWPSNKTITVTAEENVVLTNIINANDKKTLDVYFDGISEAGDNNGKQTFTAPVSVADIEAALFGTWNGTFYYNVDIETVYGPGLYDANNVQLASWDELVYDYGMDISTTEYSLFKGENDLKTTTTSPYYILTNNSELSTGVKLIMSDSVTTISKCAFAYCANLTTVEIPDSVTTIKYGAFQNTGLTSITIPDSVINLADWVFGACTDLTGHIILPDGISYVPNGILWGCPNVSSVTIPAGITKICNDAFYECTSLETITFEGTVEEWNALDFGGFWNGGVPATEVICSNGTVALS